LPNSPSIAERREKRRPHRSDDAVEQRLDPEAEVGVVARVRRVD
jgi:hypothetical protein